MSECANFLVLEFESKEKAEEASDKIEEYILNICSSYEYFHLYKTMRDLPPKEFWEKMEKDHEEIYSGMLFAPSHEASPENVLSGGVLDFTGEAESIWVYGRFLAYSCLTWEANWELGSRYLAEKLGAKSYKWENEESLHHEKYMIAKMELENIQKLHKEMKEAPGVMTNKKLEELLRLIEKSSDYEKEDKSDGGS